MSRFKVIQGNGELSGHRFSKSEARAGLTLGKVSRGLTEEELTCIPDLAGYAQSHFRFHDGHDDDQFLTITWECSWEPEVRCPFEKLIQRRYKNAHDEAMRLPTRDGGEFYRGRKVSPVRLKNDYNGPRESLAISAMTEHHFGRYDSQILLMFFQRLSADELCAYMVMTRGSMLRRFNLPSLYSDYHDEEKRDPERRHARVLKKKRDNFDDYEIEIVAKETGFRKSYAAELIARVRAKTNDFVPTFAETILLRSDLVGMRPTWVRWWTICDMLARKSLALQDEQTPYLERFDYGKMREEVASKWLWDRSKRPNAAQRKVRERDLELFFESSLIFDSPVGRIVFCCPQFPRI